MSSATRGTGGSAKSIGSLGIYFLSAALTAVSSVAGLLFVARAHDSSAWLSVALGQAVGTFGAVVIGWGWTILGAMDVAKAHPSERMDIVRDSARPRLLIMALVAPLLAVFSAAIATDRLTAALVCAGVCGNGLTLAWAFVGIQRPAGQLWSDVTPRAVLILSGGVLASLTSPWVFGVGLLSASLVAPGISGYVLKSMLGAPRSARAAVRPLIKKYRVGLASDITASLYLTLPLVFLSHFGISQTSSYAAVERVQRILRNGFWPLIYFGQGWALEKGPRHVAKRVRTAWALGVALGCLTGAAASLLLPRVASLLSGGSISPDPWLGLPFGVILGAEVVSMSSGMIGLLAYGKAGAVAAATAVAAGTLLITIVPLTIAFGVLGAAWSLAISQLLLTSVLARQLAAAARQAPELSPSIPVQAP